MAARFPLHRFSQNESSNILLCMQAIDRLSYSLCSQKCKKQVVNLNLRELKLSLWFTNEFCVITDFPDDTALEVKTRDPMLNLNASRSFRVKDINLARMLGREDGRPIFESNSTWNYDLFSGQDWLRHHLDIYHRNSIDGISFHHIRFDREQLIGMLERLSIENLECSANMSQEHNQMIMDLRLPVKHYTIFLDSFNRPELLRKILIENLDHVFIQSSDSNRVQVTLDDILLSNISQLQLNFFRYSGKQLNRFVKSWIRGASKRLEVLCIVLLEPINADIVLRGITHTEITRQDLRAKIETYGYNREPFEPIRDEGGFNIRGKDGREATVVVARPGARGMPVFQLFVW